MAVGLTSQRPLQADVPGWAAEDAAASENAQANAPRASRRPARVMLLVSSLEHGGAERQVVELVRNLDRARFDPFVCSLSDIVPLAHALPDPERHLVIVPKRSRYDATTVTRVAKVMRQRRVDIVHAFLFDAEMVARLSCRMGGVPVVISSERNTDYKRPWSKSLCLRLTQPLSDALIANSFSGKRFVMRTLGLADDSVFVVHNGVDVKQFRPGSGSAVRRELGIGDEDLVVGMVASFKQQKNHDRFFKMAEAVWRRYPSAWFVCVGEPLRDNLQGAHDYHRRVRAQLATLDVRDRCKFLGCRNDMPDVYNACDVTVLTSSREGTPNVVLESMACGVPVVATDVSDNARVVPDGRAGFVVPLGDVDAMTVRVMQLLQDRDLHSRMGRAARDWVESEFSTAALAKRTETVYAELLRRHAATEA